MNKVITVDEKDKPIGLKSYSDLQYEDIYRVSALWLTDINGSSCLLTQRKWTKRNDPGKWMAAASGTIEEGETYDDNIVHEIEEEIGLTGLDLAKGPKEFIDEGKHRFFVQWYFANVDKDKVKIKIQEDEVENFKWITIAELTMMVNNHTEDFVPTMAESLHPLGVL
ncbi:MAG TPA: NUDIX hydrolase [Candidatus Saccharimonadales bacterium]|nr:NUDIX hydrolase [Candidatus Saccharimonadales bacterium]